MSESERWIVVENWKRFQHYLDGPRADRPLWIKSYVALLHDDDYLGLTLHQRGVLHGLWLEYATARRQLRDSTATISRRLGERVTRATLDALNDAGWITYHASKPLAARYQPDSPDRERDTDTPLPPTGKSQNDKPNRRQETPTMIDINEAARRLINGNGWDEATNEDTMRETLGRLKSPGTLDIDGALQHWQDERGRRYPAATDAAA